MAERYTARFHPQAWSCGYAIDTDVEGPDTWDCTEFMAGLAPHERAKALVPDCYMSDAAKDRPEAPQWVRDWDGPYYVTILLAADVPPRPDTAGLLATAEEMVQRRKQAGWTRQDFVTALGEMLNIEEGPESPLALQIQQAHMSRIQLEHWYCRQTYWRQWLWLPYFLVVLWRRHRRYMQLWTKAHRQPDLMAPIKPT